MGTAFILLFYLEEFPVVSLKKEDVAVWAGLIWHRIYRPVVGFYEHGCESSGFIKFWKFHYLFFNGQQEKPVQVGLTQSSAGNICTT